MIDYIPIAHGRKKAGGTCYSVTGPMPKAPNGEFTYWFATKREALVALRAAPTGSELMAWKNYSEWGDEPVKASRMMK